MYKLLILFSVGAVIDLCGCVVGYFAGQFWGGIICIVGSSMMLAGSIAEAVKYYKEKRNKKK